MGAGDDVSRAVLRAGRAAAPARHRYRPTRDSARVREQRSAVRRIPVDIRVAPIVDYENCCPAEVLDAVTAGGHRSDTGGDRWPRC